MRNAEGEWIVTQFLDFLRQIAGWVVPFIILAPWEQAVRVRAGKHLTVLSAGIHLKLPLLDSIYTQSVRLRLTLLDRQTISTADGRTVTLVGAVGFEIISIENLYQKLHHAEDTVKNLAMATLASYVSQHPIGECSLKDVGDYAATVLARDLMEFGLGNLMVCITDFTTVRAYRLVGEQNRYLSGSDLRTEKPV